MRILALAESCNPDWPSFPAVTYNYICALAEYAEVHVVTQIRNQPNIERDGIGKAQVTFIDTEWVAAPLHRFTSMVTAGGKVGRTLHTAMSYPSYLAFEWIVWKKFKTQLESGEFDVVHRMSPLSPTTPSPIATLSPIPFVIGPINGGLPWPKNFQEELSREREWLSYVRDFYKILPYYRSTYSKAAAILASFQHTIKQLPATVKDKVINFPEVGLSPKLFNQVKRSVSQEKMTILYVGRLVPYKLPEVVVQAFAKSSILQKHQLVIVGDGPEELRLQKIVDQYQINNCVKFLGRRTQAEVGKLMGEAEIFAFPSIRELGAGVVIEAMACGLACVVVDYGGPADLIASERGIKVSMGSLDFLIKTYVEKLESLVQNPEYVAELGKKAHEHAMRYYSWEAKALKTIEIYRWIIQEQTQKPNFWK